MLNWPRRARDIQSALALMVCCVVVSHTLDLRGRITGSGIDRLRIPVERVYAHRQA